MLEAAGQYKGGEWNHNSYELKLKEWLWNCFLDKRVKAELLILQLVEALTRAAGAPTPPCASAPRPTRPRRPTPWFFVRAQDWVAGSPFNSDAVEPMSLLD